MNGERIELKMKKEDRTIDMGKEDREEREQDGNRRKRETVEEKIRRGLTKAKREK